MLLAAGFVADTSLLEMAGTAAVSTQTHYRLFIENAHEHPGKIVQHLSGKWPENPGTIPERQYEVRVEEIEAN